MRCCHICLSEEKNSRRTWWFIGEGRISRKVFRPYRPSWQTPRAISQRQNGLLEELYRLSYSKWGIIRLFFEEKLHHWLVRVDAQNEYSVINQSSAIINSSLRAENQKKYFDHIDPPCKHPEAFDGITRCSSRISIDWAIASGGSWG